MLELYYRERLSFFSRQVNDRHTAAGRTQQSLAHVLAARSSGQAAPDLCALVYRSVRRDDALDAPPEDQHTLSPQRLQPEVIARSDRKVQYECVARVMAAVQRSGIPKLGLVAEPGN
ncbi:hypothetical protein PEC18_36485 [Paucibacter sp. O1-1]|nr:hypothetical protein [Paucibacter sp. O1-1]MDA3831152.1 hypothetical protein [Paucibacter sp. O1-1]